MTVDNTFMVKRIQKKESICVAYCAFTGMPFVTCDPETYNDQVWIFDTEEQLQKFAKPYLEKKILLQGIKYRNADMLKFFSSLFAVGVNELVFTEEGGEIRMGLEQLVKKPDYSKIPKQRQPVLNPNLQLTGIYFMQEASRPVPKEEKENLKELEEELSANLVKSRYIIPIELSEGEGTLQEKLKNNQYKLPIIKLKDESIFQPAFTDTIEFEKFARGKKLSAIALPFDRLRSVLTKDAKGFMLNPNGFHITLPAELLENLPKRFQ